MLPTLQVGPFAIPVSPMIILIGLWVGLSLAERNASRYSVNANDLYNLVFIALVAGVIGARLAYIARYPAIFAASPISALSTNPGLLDPWGGIAVGLIAALIYGQRKQIAFWPLLDAITPGLALLWVALGFSHLASGSAFGMPTELPWGIELWGAKRQPTQIYEIIAALVILIVVWPGSRIIIGKSSGSAFLIFSALTAGARLFLEAFRGDSVILIDGLRAAQIIAWVILALSLWGLIKINEKGYRSPDNKQEQIQ
jgi:phosphatidylglycerol:prolipoprotein diacylglycerol transferase